MPPFSLGRSHLHYHYMITCTYAWEPSSNLQIEPVRHIKSFKHTYMWTDRPPDRPKNRTTGVIKLPHWDTIQRDDTFWPMETYILDRLEPHLNGRPAYPKTNLCLTILFFVMWCLVGYLTPESAWERDPNGVWKGYKGKSNYCEKIRHRIPRIYNNKNNKNLTIPTNNNTTSSSSTNTFMAQPVNSLSNYTYVAYAFIVFSLFIFDVQSYDLWLMTYE